MKKGLITLVSILILCNVGAQDFVKGGNYITVGFGIDPYHGNNGVGNAFGTYKKSGIGPVIATYERGITDVLGIGRIGVGGSFAKSWYTQKDKYGNIEDVYRTSRFSFMAKAAYHFEFGIEKMDVYAGIAAGAHFYTDKNVYYSPFNSSANSQGYVTSSSSYARPSHYEFIGIRYYFSESFGVYAEVGYGLAALTGGIVFSF